MNKIIFTDDHIEQIIDYCNNGFVIFFTSYTGEEYLYTEQKFSNEDYEIFDSYSNEKISCYPPNRYFAKFNKQLNKYIPIYNIKQIEIEMRK